MPKVPGWLIPVVLLLAGTYLGLWGLAQHYKRQAVAGAFRADSLIAINDTTHRLTLGALDGAMRRAVQVKRERDSLDRKLKLTTVALATARLAIRGVDTLTLGTTDTVAAGAAAHFEMDQTPFHVKTDVVIPPPPDTARMRLRIRLDTAALAVRTLCATKRVRGVYPASILFVTPPWLAVTLDTAQVTPLACNMGILEGGKHRLGYFALRGGVLAGAAFTVLRLLGVR